MAPSTRKKLPLAPLAPLPRSADGSRPQAVVGARTGGQPSYVAVMRLIGVALLASPIALAAACGPATPEARPPGMMQPVNVPPTASSSGNLEPTGPVPLGGAPMPVTPGPAASGAASAPAPQ